MNDLQKLYDVLVREGKYTKSFEEFQAKWSSDDAYKNKVYDVVSRDGLYTKDRNSFMQKYSGMQTSKKAEPIETQQLPEEQPLKKKEQPTQKGMASNVAFGSLGFQETKPERYAPSVLTPEAQEKYKQAPPKPTTPTVFDVEKATEALKESKEQARAEYQRDPTIVASEERIKAAAQREKDLENSFGTYMGNAFGIGAANLNEILASVPEGLYTAGAAPQNLIAAITGWDIEATPKKFKETFDVRNPVLDYVQEERDKLIKDAQKFERKNFESTSIYENLVSGNYKDAFQLMGSGIAQSAPVSIAMMMGGATMTPVQAASVSTLGFLAPKVAEAEAENPDVPAIINTIKGLGLSASESVFGAIGTGTIGSVWKDIVTKEGVEEGAKIFRSGLIDMYKEAIKKYGSAAGAVGEGLEEVATQITQNMINGKNPFDGVADAFLLGLGSGTVMASPISATNAVKSFNNKVERYNAKKEISGKLKETGNESLYSVYNKSVNDPITKEQIDIALNKHGKDLLGAEVTSSVKKGNITEDDGKQTAFVFNKIRNIANMVNSLDVNDDTKVEIANLLNEKQNLESKIKDKDAALTIVERNRITEINKQIEDAVQKQTTDEGLLRAEQPEVGLQEVGEGDQVTEVITEEGKPKEEVKVYQYNDKQYEIGPDIFREVGEPEDRLYPLGLKEEVLDNGELIKTIPADTTTPTKKQKYLFNDIEYEIEGDAITFPSGDGMSAISFDEGLKNDIITKGQLIEEATEVVPEKTLEEIQEEAKRLDELLMQSRKSVGGSLKNAAQQQNTRRLAMLAGRSLAKVSPQTTIILYETPEAYAEAVKESPNSQGMFETGTNTIHINLQYADDVTLAHEVFHAVLFTKIKTDAKAQAITKKMMESVRKVLDDNDQLSKRIDEFARSYEESLKDEERLAELIGIMAIEYEQLPMPAKNAIIKFIQDLANLFGIDLSKTFQTTDEGVIEMLNTLAGKIGRGEAIVAEDITAIEREVADMESLSRGRLTINDIVKTGRANGISDKAIELVLENRGFSVKEISAALKEETGVAKKVEVTEEMLPGYERMLKELDGVVEKSFQRGVAYEQTMDNAINYLQGSRVYQDATDIQREQMVRDVRKRFGKKEKMAPSVGKALEKPKKKVEVEEMAALKDQLRLEARAAREAKADLNSKRKMLSDAVRKMASTGKITAKKSAAIINKIGKVNLDSKKAVDSFIEYAGNVFADAEYANKLSEANSIKKQIKKLSKNKEKAANLRDLGQRFSEIDPSMVDDIDTYNEVASKIKESLRGSTIKGNDVAFADIIKESDIIDYINQEIESQRQKLFDMKVAEVQELLGVDASELNYEQLIELLSSDKEISEKDEVAIRDTIKKAFGLYSSMIKQSLKTGTDLFTGEDVEYTQNQKKLVSSFMDMNTNMLTAKDALEAVDALMNFIQNGSTAKMGAVLAKYNGEVNAKELADKGIKASPLKKYWSKAFGRFLGEQTTNLNILFEKMFKGFNRGGMVEDASGVTALKNKKSKAQSEANAIVNDYVKELYSKKANGEDFNTAYNDIERGMASSMMRNVIGTEAEIDAEFKRRKNIIEQSIAVLAEGNEQEVEKSKLYQKAYDKILKDSENISDVKSKTDKTNLEGVEFWINQWSDKYEQLADVSLNIYNKILGKDINYTPDKFTKLSSDTGVVELSTDDMLFHANNGTIYKKETGVLMEATRPESLPKNPKNGEVSRYIDLSFDKTNANAMYDALVDINTAEAIRQVEAFLNSKSFRRIVPQAEDAKILKDRINLFVRNIRNKNPYSDDELSLAVRKLNKIAAIGVGQALGGVLQPVRQVVPVAMNTLMNAGGLDIGSIFSDAKNNFINKSGYAIANRGIESQAQVDSINKLIDKAAESKAGKALSLIEEANKKWLEIFLVKPDVFIARASWMSYYEQSLKEQGIDPNTIDYNTHEVNDKAADYAQRMVDRQQNVSDSDLAGKLFADKESTKQVFIKMLMPFASFRMNQSSRLGSDLGTLMSDVSTKEDKKIAAKSLAGFGVEMATFRLLSLGTAVLVANIAKEILGREDDEEKDKKKSESLVKGQVTSAVADLFSPLPLTDKLVQAGVAGALEKVQQAADVAEEDMVSIYSGSKQDFIQSLGLFGIAADRATQLYDVMYLSNGGTFKDNYGKEKSLTEEDAKVLKMMIIPSLLTNIGLAPVELNSVVRTTLNDAKRNAVGEKSEKAIMEKSLLQGYDSKSDMKRYDPELYEKTFGEGSAYYNMNKPEKERKAKIKKAKQEAKDRRYNYTKGQKGGFGSAKFGQ